MPSLTLYELNARIKKTVKSGFPEPIWITAEIAEMQMNRSGHCYLQLADKREGSDEVLATARATIWAFTFRTLRPYFETTTGRAFAKGIKVLLSVEVVFHELYGFSLNVKDIDPTYTIGDLERRKQEILKRLEQEGVIDMNRRLEFPLLPKNIAVISSPTAAGWGDFRNHLQSNAAGFHFHVKLFPAIMQGEKTAESVIAALERIYAYSDLFDVVVLIRGGGSQIDLGSFDNYELAFNLAQFPLPVISGIGHERDETIADRVAYLRVKTPTAAATFLIECFQRQEAALHAFQEEFVAGVQEMLHDQAIRQMRAITDFKRLVSVCLTRQDHALQLASEHVKHASSAYVKNRMEIFFRLKVRIESRILLEAERQYNHLDSVCRLMGQGCRKWFADNKQKLEVAATAAKYVDPRNVLERGYTITRFQGKAVKKGMLLFPGDRLETEWAEGKIESIVVNGSTNQNG